jgi:hypothetical protein|tara:strand:+ start:1528 stop:1809 length:282 start_codon:yes stop_codon:yes gene_type:complete
MKKTKGYSAGGKTMKPKGMKVGGKLPMVTNKQGKEVPFFAADGEGKMSEGGKVMKTKGYFKGGKTMPKMAAGGGTGKARGCGAARQQTFTKNG